MQTTATAGVRLSDKFSDELWDLLPYKHHDAFGVELIPEYFEILKSIQVSNPAERQIVEMCINYPDLVRIVDLSSGKNGDFALVSKNFFRSTLTRSVLLQIAESCNEVATCIRDNVTSDGAELLANNIEMLFIERYDK